MGYESEDGGAFIVRSAAELESEICLVVCFCDEYMWYASLYGNSVKL